jgi:hypothetical protein
MVADALEIIMGLRVAAMVAQAVEEAKVLQQQVLVLVVKATTVVD